MAALVHVSIGLNVAILARGCVTHMIPSMKISSVRKLVVKYCVFLVMSAKSVVTKNVGNVVLKYIKSFHVVNIRC